MLEVEECFLIEGSWNNLIKNSAHYGGKGIVLSNEDGGGNYNKISGCTAIGNTEQGIVALSGTEGNYILHNTAWWNVVFDLQDENGDCYHNRWKWKRNYFLKGDPDCIR